MAAVAVASSRTSPRLDATRHPGHHLKGVLLLTSDNQDAGTAQHFMGVDGHHCRLSVSVVVQGTTLVHKNENLGAQDKAF